MRPLDKEQKECFRDGFDRCMTKILEQEKEITNLKHALGTLISWDSQMLGMQNVKLLQRIIDGKDKSK